MSTDHKIRVFFDQDQFCAEVTCDAATDADCRLSCDEGCEEWGPITRDEAGGIWHYVDDDGTGQIHCNYPNWINRLSRAINAELAQIKK